MLGGLSLVAALVAPATARAEPPKDGGLAQPIRPAKVERNSIPMMITGIGLLTLGVVAVGVGTGLLIEGHQVCDSEAASASVRAENGGFSTSDALALYGVTEDICVGKSEMINGGLASTIGGSVFAAAGVAFTIGGAWKVAVPERVGAHRAPSLRIGLGSVAFAGSF